MKILRRTCGGAIGSEQAANARPTAISAIKTRLAELGNEIQAMTPGALATFLRKEDQTVAQLEKTGLLKPE